MVEKAEKILVTLSDKQRFEAVVVGVDPKTDIALIRIKNPGPLPFVQLGDSDRAEVGEWVMAIGNPCGLEQTVTVGIVSAKGRVIGSGPYDDYIQTDASINPGNSGGPLFNLRGVIDYTATKPFESGDRVYRSTQSGQECDQTVENERATRGWLGVMIQEFTRLWRTVASEKRRSRSRMFSEESPALLPELRRAT